MSTRHKVTSLLAMSFHIMFYLPVMYCNVLHCTCTVKCTVYFTVNDLTNGLVRILANLESNRVCRQSQNFHSKKPVRKILIFFNSLMSRIRF